MKIGIVAGEPSGDYLGAGLINALSRRIPKLNFIGIGGPLMEKAGLTTLFEMERISIMGLDELLRSVHDILKIRRSLYRTFLDEDIPMFVGIDVPDFNLGLEEKLRGTGVTTVHYVSPTVWAWRSYRIRKIRRSVCHMLTLFPFEAAFYQRHGVPVDFVGHPIADEVDPEYDKYALRAELGLPSEGNRIAALLPGSRMIELQRLGELFIEVARELGSRVPDVRFVAPFANEETRGRFESLLERNPDVAVDVVLGKSRTVIAASDAALLASGTAALEAALLRVPMVVTYKGSWLSAALVKMLAHVEHFSMPNHLLDEPIVPEYFQADATVENLAGTMSRLLLDQEYSRTMSDSFGAIMSALRCGASERAAEVVAGLMR
jgi:lipid-A-disaccharide synthase